MRAARQLAAVRGLVTCAGPAEVATLAGWLTGGGVPTGVTVDAELRWLVLHRLVVLGAAGDAEITDEAARDPSAPGAEHAARCRAAIPTAEAKARAWDVLINDEELSVRFLTAAAEGFWHAEQHDLTAPYGSLFRRDAGNGRTPDTECCLASSGVRLSAVRGLRRHPRPGAGDVGREDLEPTLRRVAIDATDELSRAWTARNHYA